MQLADMLDAVLQESARGMATRICEHTSISKSELSLYRTGMRDLPAYKLVEAIDFLITDNVIDFTLEVVKRG